MKKNIINSNQLNWVTKSIKITRIQKLKDKICRKLQWERVHRCTASIACFLENICDASRSSVCLDHMTTFFWLQKLVHLSHHFSMFWFQSWKPKINFNRSYVSFWVTQHFFRCCVREVFTEAFLFDFLRWYICR